MTTTPVPTSVTLRLPEGWWELDPRAEDIVAELSRAIGAEKVAAVPQETLMELLIPLGIELRRLSDQVDPVLVGLYTHAIQVAGMDKPLVVTAQVLLALSRFPSDLDTVRMGLSEQRAGQPAMRLTPVTLPAGEAVQEVGPVKVRHPDWEAPVTAHQRRYFLPVAGSGRVAVLTFLTPNLDLVEAFDGVFEAIAETLSFGFDEPEAQAPGQGT
jgi:hypothetical protein